MAFWIRCGIVVTEGVIRCQTCSNNNTAITHYNTSSALTPINTLIHIQELTLEHAFSNVQITTVGSITIGYNTNRYQCPSCHQWFADTAGYDAHPKRYRYFCEDHVLLLVLRRLLSWDEIFSYQTFGRRLYLPKTAWHQSYRRWSPTSYQKIYDVWRLSRTVLQHDLCTLI